MERAKRSNLASKLKQQTVEPASVKSPETDQIKSELEAILESASFLRSQRDSSFLRFVCEATLKGEATRLNEYVIAHEVFGRGDDYSPGEDSVVRRQAHSLRQRLHEYYEHEGRNDSLRIELPLGRYVPVFTASDAEAASGPEMQRLPVSAEKNGFRHRGLNLALISLAALGLVTLGWSLGHRSSEGHRSALDPALTEIWKPWLASPEGAMICFSNPMTAVVKQYPFLLPTDRESNPPPVTDTPEQADYFRRYFQLPPGGHFFLFAAKSQSKMGETLGSVTLTSMLTRAGVAVHSTQSRFLTWENFRNENLILLGHDEANAWLDPILDKLPIRMVMNARDKPRHILDTTQGPAQEREYYLGSPSVRNNASLDYSLISMIPGLDGKHQLLLINGLNTEGTQIGLEYLCDARLVDTLLSQLRSSDPNHRGNWHFQVLLRTEVRDQVPTTADLLRVKVL